MNIVSLFSGAGGLDLGFANAGFNVVWANEFDLTIAPTFRRNFPQTFLDTRSIIDIDASEIPRCDGIVGGPPCQSWSEAGNGGGMSDSRGRLFDDYIRVLTAKRPLFFLAENVSGIVFEKHSRAFQKILRRFCRLGYNVTWHLLNANDYNVPQDRERVIIVGYLAQYGIHFQPPTASIESPNLRDAIWDLRRSAIPALPGNRANPKVRFANHEFYVGDFSQIYMSRNRVRPWDRPSFTIQASGRHAPLHPQSPAMVKIGRDRRGFVKGEKYRRLSVRECARIQTFPDAHVFEYRSVSDGYKMVGNAVPVNLAHALATQIMTDILGFNLRRRREFVCGSLRLSEPQGDRRSA